MVEQVIKKKEPSIEYVKNVYAKLAPFYDMTFGRILLGRRRVITQINKRSGKVLEVGVGTGLHLGLYDRKLEVTGVDLSKEMLDIARKRVEQKGYSHVKGLVEMDAAALDLPAASFKTVVAMYLLTVVENPDKVMAELHRVCEPGGEVIIVNHFAADRKGLIGWLERLFEPIGDRLGWRTQFFLENLLSCSGLRLVEVRSVAPFGLFRAVRFVREEGDRQGETPVCKQVGVESSDKDLVLSEEGALSVSGGH